MYDPRVVNSWPYPAQDARYANSQPANVVYTQPPVSYVPQGQPMMQQNRVPMNPPSIQQPQEQLANFIRARYITSPEEIQLGEVPMDGSMPLFMLQDRSAIVGKFWDKDAQLKTVRYIPEIVQESTPEPQVPMVQTVIDPDISERLTNLELMMHHCLDLVKAIPTESNYTIQTISEPVTGPATTASKSSNKKVSNNA